MKSQAMLVKPRFFGRDFSTDPELVFVLSPFKSPFDEIFNEHIKKVVEKFGLVCQKADDIFSPHQITEDIWQQINKARFIIADLTHKNPNVFYEVGIAHTVGKDVILITQSKDDVPFDLQYLRYIYYEYTPPGMREFEDKLNSFVSELLRGESDLDYELIETQALLKKHFARWKRFDLIPSYEIFKEITIFADDLKEIISNEELAFMLRTSLWCGSDLIYWAQKNKSNQKVVDILIDVLKRPERRPFFRVGLVLEYLESDIRNKVLQKVVENDFLEKDLVNIVIKKAQKNETLEYWENELHEIIGKSKARELLIQANTSKRIK